MSQISKIILTVIITAVIIGSGVYLLQQTEVQNKDWISYKSTKGFSFEYPPGYKVSENSDPGDPTNTIVFIVSNKIEDPVPSLQMNVSPNSITFSLWERIPWEGFPKIVETFKNN